MARRIRLGITSADIYSGIHCGAWRVGVGILIVEEFTILLSLLLYPQHCHKYENLRDEVYCQLMKQTTSNKTDSCQRGWRLLSIVAAYFMCSETLRPFLLKYLETAAYDKRRAFHGKLAI